MDDLVLKLRDNPNFKGFQLFILEKLEELDTVSGLSQLSDEQAGQEAKVRDLAKKKLIEILSPFVDFREKKGPSPKELEKAQKKFGL